MNILEQIQLILDWSEEHPEFDTGFVLSMQERLEAGNELTDAQKQGIDNIIEKFHIS